MSHKPTDEQQTAINLANDENVKRLKILAFAGAGKTSTLTMIAESMPEQKGIYLAFNKAIVADIQKKLPPNVEARTFHSLAYNHVGKAITAKMNKGDSLTQQTYTKHFLKHDTNQFIKLKGNKIFSDEEKRLRKNLNKPTTEKIDTFLDEPKQFKILKMSMDRFLLDIDPNPTDRHIKAVIGNALKIELEQGIEQQIIDLLLSKLVNLWNDYKDPKGIFKIPAGVYMKLYALSNPKINKDFVLFDEAQDADPLMLHILKCQNIKVILVGDKYQQLYEWRGANNALEKIDGTECHLTQSFRFGSNIAVIANYLLKQLGCQQTLSGVNENKGNFSIVNSLPSDINAIVCRSNLGVIESALEYSAKHPRKNIFVDTTGEQTELLSTLNAIEKLSNNPADSVCKSHSIIKFFDNIHQLSEYVKAFPSDLAIAPIFKLWHEHGYSKVKRILDNFASDERKRNHDVRIQTIHKSKGLEWHNVAYWSDFDSFFDEHDNIHDAPCLRALYVAYTRAKSRGYQLSNDVNAEQYLFLKNNHDSQERYNDDEVFELVQEPFIDPFLKHEPQLEPVLDMKPSDTPKRHYTPRNATGEAKRKALAEKGYKKALNEGRVGRPKASNEKQRVKIIKLLEADWKLQDIADVTNLSLSTIKRIKREINVE